MTLPGNITLERVDPAASTPIPSTDGYAELKAGITAPEGTQMNLDVSMGDFQRTGRHMVYRPGRLAAA